MGETEHCHNAVDGMEDETSNAHSQLAPRKVRVGGKGAGREGTIHSQRRFESGKEPGAKGGRNQAERACPVIKVHCLSTAK